MSYLPQTPYVDYNDEAIYFSDEPDVVQSLMRHFDDVWTDTVGYATYANITGPLSRNYPTYAVAPEFNFPPVDSYFNRLHPLMRAEAARPDGKIDVTMYRITDARDADDMIFAVNQGIPVRLYTDTFDTATRHASTTRYNVDRMWMAGVEVRMRAHLGLNHQKTVQLYSQGLTIFGTSNWSTASDDNQLEVNYFTNKTWFFQWFRDLFERKWNNSHVMPDGTNAAETQPFVPLPPDKPVYSLPANGATAVDGAATVLKWAAGNWARQYDIYLGTTTTPPLLKTNVNLGPGNRVVHAADAADRHDLLLEDRLEDDGEPAGERARLEFHDHRLGAATHSPRAAGVPGACERGDRRRGQPDADVERGGCNLVRRQIRNGQSAATGNDVAGCCVVFACSARREHDLFLADCRQERSGFDGRTGLVVHDRRLGTASAASAVA